VPDTRELTADEQLDEWLESSLDEIGDEPADQEQADRLLWALRGVRRRRAEVTDVGKARVQMISVWAGQQTDQLDARAAHLERLLEGWTRAEHDRSGRKSWPLPAGQLKLQARRTRSEVDARMEAADAAHHVGALVGTGMLPSDAVKVERTVRAGTVKDNTVPGDVIPDYPNTPEGYEARTAVGTFDFGGAEPVVRVVPGVVLLVPKPGREGQTFAAVTS